MSGTAFDTLSESLFGSFSQGEFELDWITASTNSRVFGWLALPGDLPIDWVPHIYRRVLAT